MRRRGFGGVFFVLLLCLVVVGYLRGWFAVTSHPDETTNKVGIELTVDPDKAKADANEAAARIGDAVKQGADTVSKKAHETTQK